MSAPQPQLNGSAATNGGAPADVTSVPVTNGQKSDSDVKSGNMVQFLELVGNLKVSARKSPDS